MLPAEGKIEVNGTVGYVSQNSWVISGTIRDNILFGMEFIPEKYQHVLYVCALDKVSI